MPTSFAQFKYPHGGRPLIGPVRRGVMYGGAVLALLATVLAFPVGAALWLVPVVARLSAARYLQIGPRYLLCGDTILYYGNVQRMVLAKAEGRLTLYGAGKGKPLVIERSKFPTNARKPDKIAKNKDTKFEKVSARIVGHVLQAAPGTRLEEA
ncbi:MAG: hypothetical protein ACRC4O_03290 [Giesbergeria sp.]